MIRSNKPIEIFLVCDAYMGIADTLNYCTSFNVSLFFVMGLIDRRKN